VPFKPPILLSQIPGKEYPGYSPRTFEKAWPENPDFRCHKYSLNKNKSPAMGDHWARLCYIKGQGRTL